MIYEGNRYKAVIGNLPSATITRKIDGASCYMQGDDALEFERQMDALDATAYKLGYPHGPFASYKEHIDAVLDAYDPILNCAS